MYSIEPEDPADSLPSSSSIEPTTTATSLAESRDSVDPESSEELYKRLHQNYRDFNEGVQLILNGQQEIGEEKTITAQDQIFAGARKCMIIEGCDIGIYLDAIAGLLELQQTALKKDSSEDSDLIPDTVNNEESDDALSSSEDSSSPDAETQSLLRGTDLHELIELNEPVKAALNDWLTSMRPLLIDSYENYQYLRDKIAPIYKEAGLPEALLFALIATETGGKVHAYSRAGAAGLLQFMRYTGKRYGLTVQNGFDMRLDPVAATKANVAYLNDQLEILNQNLEKTLASYNGGENRIRKLNRRLNGADFWDSRFFNSLPYETRMYVPRILAAAWLFLHPEDYNLQFQAYKTDTLPLTVERDTALDKLSICLGQSQEQPDGWFRTLRNLNPRLGPQDLIKSGEVIEIPAVLKDTYEQKCLEGELIQRAHELHEAKFPKLILYTVAPGDSLIKIAARHGCTSTGELALINNLRGPRYLIRVGQKLKIPGCR
jgi:membrane-bound lytic murein transglycosylase D